MLNDDKVQQYSKRTATSPRLNRIRELLRDNDTKTSLTVFAPAMILEKFGSYDFSSETKLVLLYLIMNGESIQGLEVDKVSSDLGLEKKLVERALETLEKQKLLNYSNDKIAWSNRVSITIQTNKLDIEKVKKILEP